MIKDPLDMTSDELLSLVGKPVVVVQHEQADPNNYVYWDKRPHTKIAGVLTYILVDGDTVQIQVKDYPQRFMIEDADDRLHIVTVDKDSGV